jgi:tRNA-specific 2-thiouridylase
MSGGVDSSVAAALLKRSGHDVIGVTLQLYDHGAATAKAGSCCAGQDIHDARRVADHIGIPHYVLDYEQRFRSRVIDAFADSYVAGETPIPCVTCNSQIKFTDLLATARDLGGEVLATGHYIRRTDVDGRPALFRAADAARDQSYFLFNTSPDQLSRLLFPLGRLPKAEVRALAREFALPVADKADSQDICFVPTGHYADVIAKLRPDAAEAGDIVHVDGRRLGRHSGIFQFTVGQRKGLGVAAGEPLYVVRLDPDRREVVVGPRARLEVHRLVLRATNWLGDGDLADADGRPIHVRIRSSQAPQAATLQVGADGVSVTLDRAEPGIARGQACVFYDGDAPGARVLGGGFIADTLRTSEHATSTRASAGRSIATARRAAQSIVSQRE